MPWALHDCMQANAAENKVAEKTLEASSELTPSNHWDTIFYKGK